MQLIGKNVFAISVTHSAQGNATPLRFGLKACPSMDLVAIYPYIASSEDVVDVLERVKNTATETYAEEDDDVTINVYRLNGQKVFTINIESENSSIHVVDLAWRSDGIMFAVTTSDNTVRLVNSFSGKIVQSHSSITPALDRTGPPDSPSAKRKSAGTEPISRKRKCMPSLIGYSTHFSNPVDARAQLADANEGRKTVLDDLLGLNTDIEQLLKVKANLPKDFANIDVEQFLPKMATLPPIGMGEQDVFSARTSVDAMFHSTRQGLKSASTDIVTVAQSDGCVHLRIFDSFEVGDVDLNQVSDKPPGTKFGQLRHIVSHPFLQSLYVIVEERPESRSRSSRAHMKPSGRTTSLHLLELDLHFLKRSTFSLSTLATKATQLQNLIRYLQQIESQMTREVKTAFDLPGRFLRGLEMDLEEQDGEGSTFETSAFNTLLTGQVHGKFREWLVEVMVERNVKRWDKAVSDCLDLVRRLINENWNPAVERAGIVISRLAGIAAEEATFGMETYLLDSLRDTVDVMAVLGEDLLQDVNTELLEFVAFMRWLKREAEMANLEETSEKLDEMREAADFSETMKVMKYISSALRTTSVKKYTYDNTDSLPVSGGEGETFYDTFRTHRAEGKDKATISLKTLTNRLSQHCDQLFQQVSSKLCESVLVSYDCCLGGELEVDALEARICWAKPEYAVLHLMSKDGTKAGHLRCIQKVIDPTTRVGKPQTHDQQVENCDKVLDMKIVDDVEVIVLAMSADNVLIVSMDLDDTKSQTVKHRFGGERDPYIQAGLVPHKLEVNGRKGRRTVTVLDESGRGYGIFDLDSQDNDDDDETMSG